MGGKKKTKWRKVPLAEFTKECPSNHTVISKPNCDTISIKKEQPNPVLTYEDSIENTNQYNNEYGECPDAMLCPTSYVVYNPIEVPMYPNYVMPSDSNCCYYYLPPEMMPVQQDYTTMPYQDYIPPVKDTVYLLLPAPSVRSSHGLPHLNYDWRNRRRRRRYEGYAEYAVIPEKNNTTKQKDDRKTDQYAYTGNTESRVNKKMTSFSNSQSFDQENHKNSQGTNDISTSVLDAQRLNEKEMGLPNKEKNENAQETLSSKNQKSKEVCGVHSKRSPEKISSHMGDDLKSFNNNKTKSFCDDPSTKNSKFSAITEPETSVKKSMGIKEMESSQQMQCAQGTKICDKIHENKRDERRSTKQPVVFESNATEKEQDFINHETKCDSLTSAEDQSFIVLQLDNNNSYEIQEKLSSTELTQSALPDVVRTSHDQVPLNTKSSLSESSTVHDNHICSKNLKDTVLKSHSAISKSLSSKDTISKVHSNETVSKSHSQNEALSKSQPTIEAGPNSQFLNETASKPLPTKETISKCKSVLPQTSFTPHSFSADIFNHDAELELKHLSNLQNLKTNQSIYKLAYDENITDQSEADSRSPSPVDPETQVPKSLTNAEILIHEADSTSEAGSEDVELIPHRYESESFLNENKHMYVNKLSLAVELLRTQENLPYDDQFKRVVGDERENKGSAKGEVNLGFIDEPSLIHPDNRVYKSLPTTVITTLPTTHEQSSLRNARILNNDLEELCNDTCEEAKEVVVETSSNQDNTEDVRAGYRRMQVQFRHYFTPRAALVNPCLCCNVM